MKKGSLVITHPLVNIINERFERYKQDRADYEQEWRTDYEAWQRIYSKTWKSMEGVDWRSKIFVGLTDLKVRTVVATMNEVLLAGGKFPFMLKPTPESEPFIENEVLSAQDAEDRCRKMQTKIEDQLIEMKADREIKSAILEFVVYGNAITKCPLLVPYRRRGYVYESLGPYVVTKKVIRKGHRLAFKHINLWDFFMDQDSSGPQDGEGCIHRVKMTPGEFLRYVQQQKNFDREAVETVVTGIGDYAASYYTAGSEADEGPAREKISQRKKPISIREYWGVLTRREIERGGTDMELVTSQFSDDELSEYEELEMCVILANDEVVKVIRNPYDGWRPFQQAKFDDIPHEPWGWGIPRKMRDAQAMLNSSVRAFIDNMAISGNVIGLINPRYLAPGTTPELFPGKLLELAEGAPDLDKVLRQIIIPNIGATLLPMIELFERYASEQTVPNLLSGKADTGQPKTAYGTARLWEGAHKVLTEPMRNVDEGLIEPIVEEFYHHNMADPSLPEAYKGDMEVQATGFSSFNDRNIRGERLRLLLQMALSSEVLQQATKILPLYREIIKTLDEDPDKFVVSEQELLKAQEELRAQAAATGIDNLPAPAAVPPEGDLYAA